MSDTGRRQITIRQLLVVVLLAVVMAVIVTLAQRVILGKSHAAITGGIVGAIIAVIATTRIRRSSDQN
jgi:hypothetical protein